MFPDYQSLVKQHYEKKRNANQLSSRLSHPTTAHLKLECVVKSNNGFLRKDRKTLVDFFGENGDDKAVLVEIANCYVDIFKPLLNYLKGNTNKTDPKNIELLAWLTDFEPRPFEFGKKYTSDDLQTNVYTPRAIPNVPQNEEEEKGQDGKVEENKTPEVEVVEEPLQILNPVIPEKQITQSYNVEKKASPFSQSSNGVKQRTKRNVIIAALVAVLAAVIIFIYAGKGSGNLMGSTFSKEEGSCMYWAGDHYQQVPCKQKMEGQLVIALDTGMLNSFKKITQEDTITKNDIGRVWYIKHNNKVEFYTASGNYPLDPTLKLKPITEHIISTYIVTKR